MRGMARREQFGPVITREQRGQRGGGDQRNPIILAGPPLVCLYNYPRGPPSMGPRWGPGSNTSVRSSFRWLGHNVDIIT